MLTSSHLPQNMNNKDNFFAPEALILVVDDEPMNLTVFRNFLKTTHIQIDTADCGDAAIRLTETKKYDMIFLDHKMPEKSGIETLHEIRSKIRGYNFNTPTICLTANNISEAREKYIAEGFDDYLAKPVISKTLKEMLVQYLPKDKVQFRTEKSDGFNNSEKPSEAGIPKWLSDCDALDVKAGISFCGSAAGYMAVLSVFYSEIDAKAGNIQNFYESGDLKNYTIKVHALKSSARTIGAKVLSEKARLLEEAGEEGNEEYIRANTDRLLALYRSYENILSPIAATDKNSPDIPQDVTTEAYEGVKDFATEKAKILAVDDDTFVLNSLRTMLADLFDVSTVSSGEEALNYLKQSKVELVLLDVKMPDMDGFSTLRQLRVIPGCGEVPVVFLTGSDDEDVESRCLSLGAVDFIRKPFVKDVLMMRVLNITELYRLRHHLMQEVERKTEEIQRQKQRVEEMALQVVEALAGAIEAKDIYTNGHSRRVAQYSAEIARRYGYSEIEQKDVYIAGILHDIGKIGISDTIINKPNRLTDDEYEIMRNHPSVGANILGNVTSLPHVVEGAHWHHERFDGKGYPDGLAGDDIPEIALIIGVADAYDAMSSNRSYRKAMDQSAVRSEIEKGSGSQFSPKFAAIMLQMIDEDINYDMREKE